MYMAKKKKTKHAGLPLYKESIITKFDMYIKENYDDNDDVSQESDVITFLGSFGSADLNGMINDFITTNDKVYKAEFMEDIILEVGDELSDGQYDWVVNELKKML